MKRLWHLITGHHTWVCRDCFESRYHLAESSGRQICRCGATRTNTRLCAATPKNPLA